MTPGVVGDGAPCRVPTWVECAKNNTVLKKIEENCFEENFSFYPEFVLVFEIEAFKVGCFAFFVMPVFRSISVLNGLKAGI